MAQLPPLLVFMALILVLALYGLTVSGHFPAEFRAASLRSGMGPLVLWGTLLVAAGLVLVALLTAWRAVPTASAIIGGGAMVLFAPLLLRPFPDSFVNDRAGLLTFTGLGMAIAMLAFRLVA